MSGLQNQGPRVGFAGNHFKLVHEPPCGALASMRCVDKNFLDLERFTERAKSRMTDNNISIEYEQCVAHIAGRNRERCGNSSAPSFVEGCLPIGIHCRCLEVHRCPLLYRSWVEPVDPLNGQAHSAFALVVADALASYEVLVDSKKFTSSRVSLAVAIHLAGFETL